MKKPYENIIACLIVTIIVIIFIAIMGWVGTNDLSMELHEAGYNKSEIEQIINK